MLYGRAAMRRLHPPASVVALVLLSFVATSLPRDAWYAHRHDGDTHGHVHAGDGSHVGRSSASVRDLLGHGHGHGHDHDHAHPHGSAAEHAHAEHGEHAQADHGDARHTAEHPSVARGASDGPSFTAAADGLHAHWQAPFQPSAVATAHHVAPSAVRQISFIPPPVAASVRRALALRARAPPLSPV